MQRSREEPLIGSQKAQVALAMTFAAGYVDAVGFLELSHIFTAHMTGTTVHMAMDLSEGQLGLAAIVAGVLACFVIGSVVGRVVIDAAARRKMRRVASITLLFESALLISVLLISWLTGARPWWFLLLFSSAMGLQTATLTKVGPLTVHTTFVTGMLNKLAQLISDGIFLTYDRVVLGQRVRQEQHKTFRQAGYIWSIWLLYFAGAFAAAVFESRFGFRTLVIPIVILLMSMVFDQLQPLSLQEEYD